MTQLTSKRNTISPPDPRLYYATSENVLPHRDVGALPRAFGKSEASLIEVSIAVRMKHDYNQQRSIMSISHFRILLLDTHRLSLTVAHVCLTALSYDSLNTLNMGRVFVYNLACLYTGKYGQWVGHSP